jgi:hypothetical protein
VNLKILLKGIVAGLALTFILSQCTKIKTTDVGTELIPEIDNISTFDTTLDVVAANYLFGDSALPRLGKDAAGNVAEFNLGLVANDPQFGRTAATMFFELKPPGYKYVFENVKDSLLLDSVVLCMKWNSTWGDTNAVQSISVYELEDNIKPDSIYTTDVAFRYRDVLGAKNFAPNILDDSLFLFRQKLAKQLRIRLSDEFGQRLLSQDTADGEPYSSDSAFRAFFKGFAVVPDASGTGNSLMSFALSDTNTYLKLYYKVTKNGSVDTTSRKFVFSNIYPGGCANRIQRSYNGSQLAMHLNRPPGGDSLVYIQASPGTYAVLRLPSLDQFKAVKGNVMVHLAELSMSQVPGNSNELDNYLTVPGTMYMDFLDTIQYVQYPFLTDAFLSGRYDVRVFGGFAENTVAPTGQVVSQYRFYITRYIQNFITRNSPNFPIYLYAPYTVIYPQLRVIFGVTPVARGRVKLGGGNHSSQKMKLRIIYSLI